MEVQDIPEQYNGNDCGVFTLMYAEHLGRGGDLNFSQADMPDLRVKVHQAHPLLPRMTILYAAMSRP